MSVGWLDSAAYEAERPGAARLRCLTGIPGSSCTANHMLVNDVAGGACPATATGTTSSSKSSKRTHPTQRLHVVVVVWPAPHTVRRAASGPIMPVDGLCQLAVPPTVHTWRCKPGAVLEGHACSMGPSRQLLFTAVQLYSWQCVGLWPVAPPAVCKEGQLAPPGWCAQCAVGERSQPAYRGHVHQPGVVSSAPGLDRGCCSTQHASGQ